MIVLVNGKSTQQTSALDRGLLYGQNVFETITVLNGKACLLEQHLERLQRGCNVLGIPFDIALLTREISELIEHQSKSVLRVTLTMGEGGRGYLNPSKPKSTRILSLHSYPDHPVSNWEEGIELGIVDIKLAHQPALAGIKHGNRLEQVIARTQWRENWQEALLHDHNNNIIEGTQSNVFILNGRELSTPSLELAGVAGVVREYIISNAHKLGLSVKTVSLSGDNIEAADAVFLSNSVIGLWPVKKLNSRLYTRHEISHKLLKLMIKDEIIPHYKA